MKVSLNWRPHEPRDQQPRPSLEGRKLNFRSTIVRHILGEQSAGPVATGGEQPVTKRPWLRATRRVKVAGLAGAVLAATLLSFALTSATNNSTATFADSASSAIALSSAHSA